jgi:hypothetical protein
MFVGHDHDDGVELECCCCWALDGHHVYCSCSPLKLSQRGPLYQMVLLPTTHHNILTHLNTCIIIANSSSSNRAHSFVRGKGKEIYVLLVMQMDE